MRTGKDAAFFGTTFFISKHTRRTEKRSMRRAYRRSQCPPPPAASLIMRNASSMVKLFGFCTGGNSLKVAAHLSIDSPGTVEHVGVVEEPVIVGIRGSVGPLIGLCTKLIVVLSSGLSKLACRNLKSGMLSTATSLYENYEKAASRTDEI